MRAARNLALLTMGCLVLAACAEEVDSARRRDRNADPSTATDAPPLGEESNLALPRLTRDEYIATLGDLLHEAEPTIANEVLQTVLPLAESLPADEKHLSQPNSPVDRQTREVTENKKVPGGSPRNLIADW